MLNIHVSQTLNVCDMSIYSVKFKFKEVMAIIIALREAGRQSRTK